MIIVPDDNKGTAELTARLKAYFQLAIDQWSRFIPAISNATFSLSVSDLSSGIIAETFAFPDSIGWSLGRTAPTGQALVGTPLEYRIGTGDPFAIGGADAVTIASPTTLAFDPVSVFTHEIAHALGFTGARSASTETSFEDLTVGGAFTGPHAEAVYGNRPVPLAVDGFHFAGSGLLAADLMSPQIVPGTSVGISLLDLAALQDLGLAVQKIPATGFVVTDTSSQETEAFAAAPYSGPVAGIDNQFVLALSDNLNIVAQVPNSFIHAGSGMDAIDVSKAGGNNILDGGTGSNFLIGGAGTDTFYVDGRNSKIDVWSTVVGFHAGDEAVLWGVTPADFRIAQIDGGGTGGFTGLTFLAAADGKPNITMTLAGYITADVTSGRLTVSVGKTAGSVLMPGSGYLSVHGNW